MIFAAVDVGYSEDADVTTLRSPAPRLVTTALTAQHRGHGTNEWGYGSQDPYKVTLAIPSMQLNLDTVRLNMKTGRLFSNNKLINDVQSRRSTEKFSAVGANGFLSATVPTRIGLVNRVLHGLHGIDETL